MERAKAPTIQESRRLITVIQTQTTGRNCDGTGKSWTSQSYTRHSWTSQSHTRVKVSSTPYQKPLAVDGDLEDRASGSDDSENSNGVGKSTLLPLEVQRAVPCPNDCNEVFDTCTAAIIHSYGKVCSKRNLNRRIECPWKSIMGCAKTYASLEHLRAHYKDHEFKDWAPHMCRRGCTRRYPSLYLLVAHEKLCMGFVTQNGSLRNIRISLSEDEPPASSSAAHLKTRPPPGLWANNISFEAFRNLLKAT